MNISERKVPISPAFMIILGVLFIGGIIGTYMAQQKRIDVLNHRISQQQVLLDTSNQACLGLNETAGGVKPDLTRLKVDQTIIANDPEGKTAVFTCQIGQNTRAATAGMNVAAVDGNGREMGTEVIYFSSADKAKKYESQVLQPQRYWSVPNKDLTSGVKQGSYYTSYVSGKPMYFDAYAVKDTAIVRLTLPCGGSDLSQSGENACRGTSVDNGAAITMLRHFSDAIAPLSL